MSKPILIYDGIYSYTAEAFTEKLQDSTGDLEIWMNSPGGSVFAGWSMIAAMQEYKEKKKIKVLGNASSMAFYMLLFADEVEALDISTFIIHRADGYVENDDDKAFLTQVNKDLRTKFEARINKDVFAEITGTTLDELFSMEQRKDVVITAKQAKKIGLVDAITRLQPKQIQAITKNFMAFGETFEQGSKNVDSQGSEPELSINNQNSKHMDLQTLKAEHGDLVNQIIAQERDRVNAYMTFAHLDLEACKEGIKSGENPSQTFFAEMNLKASNALKTKTVEAESAQEIETEKEDRPKAENSQTEELKAFEKEMFKAAGIKTEEVK